MPDRLRRDAAVEELFPVEVDVSGAATVRPAVDVDVLDERVRDADRARADERAGAARCCCDGESPARSRNPDRYPTDHLQPPELGWNPTYPGNGRASGRPAAPRHHGARTSTRW